MSISDHIQEVARARDQLWSLCRDLDTSQGHFSPGPGEWSAAEIIEHLVWAEWGGLMGIWKAIEGTNHGQPVWTGTSENEGLTIEQIIDRTWQAQEKVPAGAEPKWGGPLNLWLSFLKAGQQTVEDLIPALEGLDPEKVIWPHPISGPLNVRQRMEFLRFHMDRHRKQIERLMTHPDFPG